MDISNRTVFIVGATSGIGLGLARRFASAGSTVIIGGRRTDPIDDFELVEIDVTDSESVTRARDAVLARHPQLDTVVTMAGVLLTEDLRDPAHFATAQQTIDINVLGTIRVTDAFTPHFLAQGNGAFVTVSSGIGFLPFPLMATYGASKAAVHSYSESLRKHLAGTGITVHELVPPAVATTPENEALNPAAMKLNDYLDEVVELMSAEPTPDEILVKVVQTHRWAEREGTYAELLERRSASLASLPSHS